MNAAEQNPIHHSSVLHPFVSSFPAPVSFTSLCAPLLPRECCMIFFFNGFQLRCRVCEPLMAETSVFFFPHHLSPIRWSDLRHHPDILHQNLSLTARFNLTSHIFNRCYKDAIRPSQAQRLRDSLFHSLCSLGIFLDF